MITKIDLLDLQENYNVDLIKFIDSFFEEQIARENNLEKHELLLKIYSEGWGSSIGKFAGNLVNKAGQFANNIAQGYQDTKQAADNYGTNFFGDLSKGWQQARGQGGQDPEQVATQAIEMLKNANLLTDPNLQKMMQNLVDQAKKQKQMAKAKAGDMGAVDWGKFQGKNHPIQSNRPMGGASGTGAFGRNPVAASEGFNLNFYGFTQILESELYFETKSTCSRCGKEGRSSIYEINAGKARCKDCGGFMNKSESSSKKKELVKSESSRYAGDPVRMKAKYAGEDMNGKAFKKGDEVTYYPRSKKMISGTEGEQAYRDFLSAAADEDAYRGVGGPYAS